MKIDPAKVRRMEIRERAPRAVRCSGCGTCFPSSETEASSGGYCECGGELVLELDALVQMRPEPQTVEITFTRE